jgi:hypothetical protein
MRSAFAFGIWWMTCKRPVIPAIRHLTGLAIFLIAQHLFHISPRTLDDSISTSHEHFLLVPFARAGISAPA